MTPPTRLLIVDDEATIRHFLKRLLERDGYDVLSASSATEALTLLESHKVHLLLTDIRMDRMNGVALLEQVQQLYPEMAVILLTGYATVETAIAALRHGAANYLLKPIKNDELLEAVARGLREQQREQRRDQLEQLASRFSQVILNDNRSAEDESTDKVVVCGSLMLNKGNYTAYIAMQRLNLTPTEFRLLLKFAQFPDETFDYIELVRDACGYACQRQEAQEIIGTHIRNLRQKMGVETGLPLYIEAVRGLGYRLLPPRVTEA